MLISSWKRLKTNKLKRYMGAYYSYINNYILWIFFFSIYIYINRIYVKEVIETEALFTKTEINNKRNVFLLSRLAFNTLIPANITILSDMACSCAVLLLLMLSTFSNLTVEMNFLFKKQEKSHTEQKVWWL